MGGGAASWGWAPVGTYPAPQSCCPQGTDGEVAAQDLADAVQKKNSPFRSIAWEKLPECLGNHCSVRASSSSDFVERKARPSFFLLLV